MNKFLSPLYKLIVPKSLRFEKNKENLRKEILDYYAALPESTLNSEQKEILANLKQSPLNFFPYPFHEKYNPEEVEVFYDPATRLRYVMHYGKRLYFKRKWSEKRIKTAWANLLREQDPESPHCYLAGSFEINHNDVLADIGAAEGNFSLSVIDKASKIYLFEYNKGWIEALKATFAPWKEKVEIIGKYVADFNDKSHIRLDTFFEEKKDLTFLKIDVDGVEDLVLNGCSGILNSQRHLKVALCTYHKSEDEKNFTILLRKNGFLVNPSKGYMIHYHDESLKAPFLRKGLLRAVR